MFRSAFAAAALMAMANVGAHDRPSPAAADDAEAATAAYFERVLASPPRLRALLRAMPKGGDLHTHLSGAVYAEDYLRWAAEDGLCLQRDSALMVAPPCTPPGRVAVAEAARRDLPLYGRAVDAMSMRGYERDDGESREADHRRFFASFDRFRIVSRKRVGDMLAAVRAIAADDRTAYLEIIHVPQAGRDLSDAAAERGDGRDFAAMSAALAPLLPAAVAGARAELDRDEARAAALLGCDGPAPQPGCAVELRYQVPAMRSQSPDRVFATMAFAFALAQADPRCVGVNLLGPEHHPLALRDYDLHMRMLAFLKQRYPSVPLSLHAGELEEGLVPPRELRSHIGQAVRTAGAARIGHAIAVAREDDVAGLLRRMARDRVAVEINLSSNAAILGVTGAAHPLALYRAAAVPVVLSTDDQGVLRGDMTTEYVRAAREQGLGYRELKRIARDSLQYAFLPGASLWRDRAGGERAAACAGDDPSDAASTGCARFLRTSDKARLQWRLEQQLARFEREPRLPLAADAQPR